MKPFILLAIILVFRTANAQPTFFQKIFGDTLNDNVARAVVQSESGSIYVAGNFSDFSSSATGISLIKLTADGNVQWSKPLSSGTSSSTRMIYTQDKKLLITGQVTDSTGNTDALAAKLDTTGAMIFLKAYGSKTTTEAFQGLSETIDGGYIFSGFVTNPVGIGNAFYAVKTDYYGNMQWEKLYGFPENSSSDAVIQLADGGYVMTGDVKTNGPAYNAHLIKIDSAGSIQWETNIDNAYNSGCKNLILNKEGYILVIGESATATSAYFDPFISKVDTAGNIIWSHSIPCSDNPDAGYDIIEPNPNQYLIIGYGYDTVALTTNLLVMSLDSTGNEVAGRYYGGAGYDQGYDLTEAYDHSGFLATGFITTGNEAKYFLIYDSMPGIASSVPENNNGPGLTIYPNPCTDFVFVNLEKPGLRDYSIKLFDLLGKSVYEETGAAETSHRVSLKNIQDGIYVIVITHGNKSSRNKIIVQHSE